ncbi:MAG: lipopolysaccharide biosynthesis protein, partial [Chryseobacterium sp.]
YSGMLTLALIPASVIAILLANVGVAILGGGKYVGTDAANIFRIFMLLSIVYPIDRFTGVTLDIIHQPKRNFIKVVIMLVINVVANYIGIKIFGNLYGVVFSSVLSFAAGVAYSYFSLKEFLDFDVKGILRTGYYEVQYAYGKLVNKS